MRKYLIFILVLILLLPVYNIAAFQSSPVSATSNLEEELLSDLWIAPNDYEYLLINLDEGTHFYGRYFINMAGDMRFFICDSGNLTEWMSGNENITRFWDHEYFYSGAFAITIPSGTWYIVVENYEDYSMNMEIWGGIDTTGPRAFAYPDTNECYSPCQIEFVLSDSEFGLANCSIYLFDTWVAGFENGPPVEYVNSIEYVYYTVTSLGWNNFTVYVVGGQGNCTVHEFGFFVTEAPQVSTTSTIVTTTSPVTTTTTIAEPLPSGVPFSVIVVVIGLSVIGIAVGYIERRE